MFLRREHVLMGGLVATDRRTKMETASRHRILKERQALIKIVHRALPGAIRSPQGSQEEGFKCVLIALR